MQVTVYLDLVFVINFIADFYVLLITGWIIHQKISMIRIVMGATFGAAVFLPCVIYPNLFMGFSGIMLSIGISMGAVAISLGIKGGFIRKWFLSTTIMVLFGGIFQLIKLKIELPHITIYTWLIFISASGIIVCIIISGLVRIREQEKDICRIYIRHQGKNMETDVLIDSGNRLWDARFNKPVILLSEDIIQVIVSSDEYDFINEYKKKGYVDYHDPILLKTPKTCFHEISFQSVGEMSGKLLCFLIEEIRVSYVKKSNKIHKCYIKQPCAIVDPELFDNKQYKGIFFSDNI